MRQGSREQQEPAALVGLNIYLLEKHIFFLNIKKKRSGKGIGCI